MEIEQTQDLHSRGTLVKTGVIAGGLVAAGALTAGTASAASLRAPSKVSAGDISILNYALTLEHLEDAMYRALINSGLLFGASLKAARQYGAQEHQHVEALTAVITKLGGTPVAARPKYNLPMLGSLKAIYNLLVTVEDLGASAYLGAAPLIQDPTLLDTAVAIHTVEAEHATFWRSVTGKDTVPFVIAAGTPMAQVVKIVTPFLG